jgi:hypothetical protein
MLSVIPFLEMMFVLHQSLSIDVMFISNKNCVKLVVSSLSQGLSPCRSTDTLTGDTTTMLSVV